MNIVAPFDPILSNMLIKNLFVYFEHRQWMMYVVRFSDGTEGPWPMNDGDVRHPLEQQYAKLSTITLIYPLLTLHEIQREGPDYLRTFLRVASELLVDHTPEYEMV